MNETQIAVGEPARVTEAVSYADGTQVLWPGDLVRVTDYTRSGLAADVDYNGRTYGVSVRVLAPVTPLQRR